MILIGFMGSGKSSIARALKRHGFSIVDTDAWIEETEKKSIAEIFESHGEDYFRTLEYQALKHVSHTYDVVSTGGGIVTHKDSFELLRSTEQTIIWLDAPVEILIRRARGGGKRPLATSAKSLRARYTSRRELYAMLADARIDTSQNKNKCVEQILNILKKA